MNEDALLQLINQMMPENKPVDLEYRLYYNKETNEPLFYSMEQLDGDYIVVTHEQYSVSRYDLIIRNGVIVHLIDAVSWTKLVPSESGTSCRADNIMIVDSDGNNKWTTKTYYLK